VMAGCTGDAFFDCVISNFGFRISDLWIDQMLWRSGQSL